MAQKTTLTVRDRKIMIYFFYAFAAVAFLSSFLFQDFSDSIEGLRRIITSPSMLNTDYIEIGGMGAALLNGAINMLIMTLLVHILKAPMSGILIAAMVSVFGFSFYGTNFVNSIPLVLGGFVYAKIMGISPGLPIIYFTTGASALVSTLALNEYFSLPVGIVVGSIAGFLVGVVTPGVAGAKGAYHKGYNLYNIGFVIGLLVIVIANSFRMIGVVFEPAATGLYEGDDTLISYFILGIGLILVVMGLVINKGLSGYRDLLRDTGRSNRAFYQDHSLGNVLFNMGVITLIAWAYVRLNGAKFTGPVHASLYFMTGFAAQGKHPLNSIPVMLGVFIAFQLSPLESSSTLAMLVAMFSTTLAPFAGEYGIIAGIIAGFMHAGVATNLASLHGWMNLYNNGLAGGIVSITYLPVLQALRQRFHPKRYQEL